MKKWMISDGKLCSQSVKRKILNTNTKWRNNISKVSYTDSIHICQYHRRGTTSWWRTQTPIKTKKIFFIKIIFIFYFFVCSEHYNINESWWSHRKIQRDMFVWWLELSEENRIVDWEWKNQEIFIIIVAVKEIDPIIHTETTSQMDSILKEVLFIVNSGKIRSQNKNKQQLKDFLTESVNKLSLFSDFYLLLFYCWYPFVKRNYFC